MFIWLCAALAALRPDDPEQQADVARMKRIAGGDASALGDVYDRHARAVYSLALRIVGEEAEAEEVIQEVFAQAWRQSDRYDESRGSVAAWLLTMTRTRAIDRVRARRARPDRDGAASDYVLHNVQAPGVDPADALAAAEDAGRLRTALSELAPAQRIAIEMAYYEGLSQTEIAERLATPLGTVKTRIRSGLLKLRDALAGGER
jgi:RNA polymerase sigma-70 factor (ECF subfamily)